VAKLKTPKSKAEPKKDLVHPECPNFEWYEVWKSETGDRLGIENTTEDEVILHNIRELCVNVVQPIRNEVGRLSPQSWFRCEPLEKHLTENSFKAWCRRKKRMYSADSWRAYFKKKSHPKGGAVDIECADLTNDELFDWILENLEFDQLIREFPKPGIARSGWVHVSWAGTENRNQAFELTANGIKMRN